MIEYNDAIMYYILSLNTLHDIFIYDVIFDGEFYTIYYINKEKYKGKVLLYSPGSGFIIDGITIMRDNPEDLDKVRVNLHNHQMLLALENIE